MADTNGATKRDLWMMRGDTFAFDIRLPDLDPETITNIYFTAKVRATDSDENAIFQKSFADGVTTTDDGWRVRVAPEDTNDIPAGKYFYDLELVVLNDVYTLMYGTLRLTQDVTRAMQ